MSEPLVIVGNGMAAARLVDELAKVALGRYAIAVIGDEPRLAYNRVLLSSVLAGETASHDIELRPAAWWRDRGVTLKYGCLATEILLNANTARIHGETRVEGVGLSDGRRIDADAVIFAAGIRPNVALAKEAGIAVNRGVVVDDHLQTGAADVFAIGECAEHRGVCYGLVEPAYEQARALARHLAGREAAYAGSIVATNLNVSGVSVLSPGDFMGGYGR